MKRALVVILAALGSLLILFVLFFVAMSWAVMSPTPVPGQIVLEYDVRDGVVEAVPNDPFALAFERRRVRVRDLVEALEVAADDRRVRGLLVRGGPGPGGWAWTEEMREAVLAFRESGKPAVLFAESFGEFGAGQAGYFLAAAFDEVILQPSGEVGLVPLVADVPFFGEMFEKLEVTPRFDAREEYKDATEMLTRSGFSEASREANEALLTSILDILVEGVASGRGLSPDSVRTLVAGGPWLAEAALEAGLVDRLGYVNDARDRIEELTEGAREYLTLARYNERRREGWNRGPRVALIHGVGAIQQGRGGFDPLFGSSALGSDRVAGHIRQAIEDDRVRAILFRVDSPGGSWIASDQVRRELERAREAGKPVVVSMSNAAASGGYLIAAPADRIVALPSTITGSIGVAAGRFVTRDLWARFGIEWDRIAVGGEEAWFTGVDDFSDEEWARFSATLDHIYDEFLRHVAEGRGRTVEEIRPVAKGRVWSGRDAHELGLVDALGGLGTALDELRNLLELEPGAPLQVVDLPAERTFFQVLLEDGWWMAVRSRGGAGVEATELEPFLRPARELLVEAGEAGLLGGAWGPVRMPPIRIPAP